MKILHTSHKGLPDHRIERAAYVAKTRGDEIHFLGIGSTRSSDLDVFDSVKMMRRVGHREIAGGKAIRDEWTDAVHKISPDIIHAHDIIAAHLSTDLKIPMVYDDHEYWSKQRVAYEKWPLWWKIRGRKFLNAIPEWERDLLEKHVVITVSEGIAEEHRKVSDKVFVLQNYCLRSEVENLESNPNREGVVFVGNDFTKKKFLPHRDLAGLKDHLEFDDLYGLPRPILYEKLTHYRFGLLPFRTFSYHKYANSAKLFDYLNCGLQVIITQSLFEAHGQLPYTIPFNDYSEIPQIIDDSKYVDPREILDYAHKHLVWEVQQELLFEAYDLAMKQG